MLIYSVGDKQKYIGNKNNYNFIKIISVITYKIKNTINNIQLLLIIIN